MSDIDPNLYTSLAKAYVQGVEMPTPDQVGYYARVNAEGNNLAYVDVDPGDADRQHIDYYGAVGDGIADDTDALNTAAAATPAGGLLYGTPGKVYRRTATWVCDFKLDLRGARLLFDLSGDTQCLDMRSGSAAVNGIVENDGTGSVTAGNYQSPIIVGDYAGGTGYHGIVIANIEVRSNLANGNGIMITGDSYGIALAGITTPSSATLGRVVLLHWGGADAPASGTTHPHNCWVGGVRCGTMTSAALDGGAVFISGCYNIRVANLVADAVAWQSGLLTIFAGDYGDYYSSAGIQDRIMTGIVVDGVAASASTMDARIAKIDCVGTLAPTNRILPGPMLRNVVGDCSATSNAAGIVISNCIGARIENCTIDSFLAGLVTGPGVSSMLIDGGQYRNCLSHGISLSNGPTPPEDCTVRGAQAYANGTTGSAAGIFIGESKRCKAIDSVVGVTSEATQDWGIRVDPAAEDCVVDDNHCAGATAVAYSMGSSTTYAICKSYDGNTAASGVTLHGGCNPQVVATMGRGSSFARIAYGTLAPTSGAWTRGSRVYNEAAVAGGTTEWVCTTSGTPGTWRADDVAPAPTIISPPTWTGDEDDYAPAGLQTADWIRINPGGNNDLTGIDAPAGAKRLTIQNSGTGTDTLRLMSNDAASLLGNRIATSGGLNVSLNPGKVIDLLYDPTGDGWWRPVDGE